MSLRLNRLHKKLAATFAVIGASAAAFACSAHGDSGANAGSNVTSVPESPVTDQGGTGSCWLYSTANWVESLHTTANGTSVHYSPAYWMYWAAYDQLVQGQTSVDFGGYWGWAADIMLRYGLMPQGSFEIDDVNAQLIAVDAINAKIQAGLFGPLSTDPDAGPQPRNPVLVRAALDEAFKLGNDTRALLTKTFGIDGTHTFDQGAAANGSILRPQDISVMTPGQWGLQQTTLDQLLGAASTDPNAGPDDRVGASSWTAVYPPTTPGLDAMMGKGGRNGVPGRKTFIRSGGFKPVAAPTATGGDDGGTDDTDAGAPGDGGAPSIVASNPLTGMAPLTPPDPVAWRAFYKRVQKAMNDGVPVPMAFSVVDGNIDSQGRFHAGPSIVPTSDWGGREVLLTDYEITNVPQYGTLAAGTATTPAQKQASLDNNASITFFRVKNSWGTDPKETGLFANAAGYNDIDTAYLEQPYDLCDDSAGLDAGEAAGNCWAMAPQMWDVILPPGY